MIRCAELVGLAPPANRGQTIFIHNLLRGIIPFNFGDLGVYLSEHSLNQRE